MSIANEISRIKNAKEVIRSAVEKRGVTLEDSVLVDSYAAVIESAPYAVKGSFTPEADTQVFSISGLPFAPKSIYLVSNELYSAGVENGVILLTNGDGLRGSCVSYADGTRLTSFISENSSLDVWSADGYEIDLSKSSSTISGWAFKAGYTYEYYITGGFSE
ncbi:MAG: hypothetical protein IJA62_04235 [Ruminococcus sp.]|nr:hypothetical protein [Ruminococcus sp.]